MPRATEVEFEGLGLTWEEHCTHNLESFVVGEKCTEGHCLVVGFSLRSEIHSFGDIISHRNTCSVGAVFSCRSVF
jgi:hypothetical protein